MSFLKNIFAALALSCIASLTSATSLDPHDMRGIRTSAGCAPTCLLDFSAVKNGTEDRTVAHFDISGVSGFDTASLILSLQDQDGTVPGSSSLDIYSFAGDGTVDVGEFDIGTLFEEITGITGAVVTVTLDITAFLKSAVSNGDAYLSFNLRNEAPDRGRFLLGHTIGGTFGTISAAGPTIIDLTGVPLPAGGVLLLSGVGVLILRRRL